MYMAISVAVGGAIGAVSRYWISSYVQHVTGGGFPWGTLAVNGAGVCYIRCCSAANGPRLVT